MEAAISPPETTGIARAIAELGAERDRVAVRLAQIDQTITLLRELVGRTPEGTSRPRAQATTTGTRSPAERHEAALLAALDPDGQPRRPHEVLEAAFGLARRTDGRRAAARLKATGALVVTGRGQGTRWARPTKRPARKEPP